VSNQRVLILGAGSWGTALALHWWRCEKAVTLWTRDAAQARSMRESRRNAPYLPGVVLPREIEVTDTLAVQGDWLAVVVAVPSSGMRELAGKLAEGGLAAGVPMVSCTKGLEYATGWRMSQILAEALPACPVSVLSGPSHAEEVAMDKPTAVVLGAEERAVAERLREELAGGHLRIYSGHDVAGIELGGALKNIYAIAAGVGDGLGLGDNSKAALVTRALAEMIRIGVALGGEAATFQGLSGVGDLMVTCFSQHSRNRRLGEWLGGGIGREEAERRLGQVAEGVPATRSVSQLVGRLGLRAPIAEVVHRMLFNALSPSEALRELMERDLRHESE